MQSLRLVGPGQDGASVVLESLDGADRFSLPLDERLRDVSQAQPPESGPAPERSPAGQALSPREIQTRVRAGESAEAVAESAGMSLEKVMRFAFPVLAGRRRVVDEARRARARRGGDGQPAEFGDLIDDRLTRHGIDATGVGWDAFRRPDGGWTVTATFTAYEAELRPKFSFGLGNRTVSALDALAADLLSDRPVRDLLPPDPDPVSELAEPGPVRLTAVPDRIEDDEPGLPATPAVQAGRRQKAHTRPIPIDADDELFDQEAFGDQQPAEPGVEQPQPSEQAWQDEPLPFDGEPAGPAQQGRPTDTRQPDDAEGRHRRARRGEKPRMPSWDDILLGVRNKND